MRAIIVGAGDIGLPVIQYLSERGHVVTVFEKNAEHCKQVANQADAAIYCASGNFQENWKTAEAEKADLLMALTNDDETNAEVCRIAKKQYGIPFVVARAHQPENILRLKEAGADVAICPSQETIRLFLNALERRVVETLYESQTSKFKIALVKVPSNATIIGKTLGQLGISTHCEVSSVLRNGAFVFPHKSFVFKGGDEVLITGSIGDVEKMVDQLRSVEVT